MSLGEKFNKIVSLFVSFVGVFCYVLSFYTFGMLYAIWIGLFTLVGASGLYKTFKGYFGLMSSNNINNTN